MSSRFGGSRLLGLIQRIGRSKTLKVTAVGGTVLTGLYYLDVLNEQKFKNEAVSCYFCLS